MPKIYLKYIYCLFLYGFLCLSVEAQEKYVLKIEAVAEEESVLRKYKYPAGHTDSLSTERAIKQLINTLHSDGYLLASTLSRSSVSNELRVKISIGEKFTWLRLTSGNVENSLLRRSGYKQAQFEEKPFRFNQVARMEKSILSFAERNGYPFASLKLDSLRIEVNQIGASLNLDLGPLIVFDSLDIKSDLPLKPAFWEITWALFKGTLMTRKK